MKKPNSGISTGISTFINVLGCLLFLTACGQEAQDISQTGSEIEINTGLRLYIFDNGEISGLDPQLFNFTADELAETDFIVTSNLIVHPDGILLWEAGAIPDDDFPEDGSMAVEGVVQASKTLGGQLADIAYSAEDIDYFALSHLHSDHTGNANEYADAHWIVQRADRDAMFAINPEGIIVPEHFSELQNSDTTILNDEDYDVFGDGSVMIISAPGHTPGHQVLLVNLPNTGPILLAGDLYHYPEEITTGRFPTFEYNTEDSAASRKKVALIVEDNNATMWIGHDKATHEGLNFSPAYYD